MGISKKLGYEKEKKKRKESQSHPTCNPDNQEPDDDVVNAADRELSLNSVCFMQKNLHRYESSFRLQDRNYLKTIGNIKQYGYVNPDEVLSPAGEENACFLYLERMTEVPQIPWQ